MTKPLDPRFGKAIRLMRSTQHDGERAAARGRAEAVAISCGLTFEQALAMLDRPAQPARPNIFAGFDDFIEEREPGWKAKRAEERAGRNAAWAVRKAALLRRYGSMEAAIAPCWRERLILDAVAPWRKARPDPEGRRPAGWTHSLGGSSDFWTWRKLPSQVLEAIRTAYPLPTCFAEAKDEDDYWQARNNELDDLFSVDGAPAGDVVLDMAPSIRAEMVRDLTEKEMPVTTLADLHARFAIMMAGSSHEPEIEKALFRDLTAMIEREAQQVSTATVDTSCRPSSVHSAVGQIETALMADPMQTDRCVARAIGCSPTTVGKVRARLGLAALSRTVHRGGQVYSIKHAKEQRV